MYRLYDGAITPPGSSARILLTVVGYCRAGSPRRAGLGRLCCRGPTRDLLEVVADAGRPFRAAQIAAAAGLSTDQARVEGAAVVVRGSRAARPAAPLSPRTVSFELAVAVAVTVRDMDAADTAVPVDALVPGETMTCLFRSAGSLGGSSPKLTRKIVYSKP